MHTVLQGTRQCKFRVKRNDDKQRQIIDCMAANQQFGKPPKHANMARRRGPPPVFRTAGPSLAQYDVQVFSTDVAFGKN